MTRFRPIPFIVCVIILASSVGVSRRVWAAPTSATPVISASETVQKLTFEHLEKQAGGAIKPPAFPDEKLLMWMDKRNETVTDNEKSRYKLLGEHLLIARQLLESDDVAARKRGFWMASESANFAAAKLNKDKWLLARIYEGFLLPRVALANTELWRDPSRSRILEAGVSAFANAGERDKQIRVLEWLISIGQKTEEKTEPEDLTLELNTLDWARGTLAALLAEPPDATRAQLERAIILFGAIQSPDMKGFKHLQVEVQARLDLLKKVVAP